jgi:guanine deaminase
MGHHFRTESDGAQDWLGMAIDLARENVAAGGWPFGAVIVRDGVLLATGVNDVTQINDPTAHAEIRAIRGACAFLHDSRLAGAVLYSSCEPCPMCLAATMWAGLEAIVYGADSKAAARAGFDDQEIYSLFDRPRDTWSTPVRQQDDDRAQAPFRAWNG